MSITRDDQIRVRKLLQTKVGFLPLELIETIFDIAEYWVLEFTANEKEVSECNINLLYLCSQPIGHFEVMKVIVETCSHDQGWASGVGSYTWSEIGIMTRNDDEKLRIPLYYNNRADASDQERTFEFQKHDQLIKGLDHGDRIAIWVRAMYPGWCHTISYARIKVYCR
ncbi:hypothetical protein HDV02_002844 [Globomyces sp. JEL0801]|nr:hypothetical protein HDV02_002844 [Globomyces sp. JEL0801]